MNNDTVSSRLGRFLSSISIDNVPPEVVEKAKACLLNSYGIGMGSDHLPYARTARRAVLDQEGEQPQGATIFGDGRKTSIAGATLANAVLFHGRNQEDFVAGSSHFGVIVPPLLTALMEFKRLPVDEMIPAVIAGYEIGVRLDSAYASRTTPNGFRGTPLFGTIAAAAAVGRIFKLSPMEMQAALGNAAAMAGGTLASQAGGTDEWRYQVGIFSNVGMTAAFLAKAGSVTTEKSFESRVGFGNIFARAEGEAGELTKDLGKDWAIMKVAFKLYPLPAWNQTPVLLGLEVRNEIGSNSVRSIEVRMNPYEVNYPGKNSPGPFETDTAAKLSILFTVATTIAHGEPTFPILLDYENHKTAELLKKMKLVQDPEVARLSCTISVVLDNGQTFTRTMRKSWSDYSFNCDAVSTMIRRIGKETNVPEEAYDRLDAFVRKLPNGGSVHEVVEAFRFIQRRDA